MRRRRIARRLVATVLRVAGEYRRAEETRKRSIVEVARTVSDDKARPQAWAKAARRARLWMRARALAGLVGEQAVTT